MANLIIKSSADDLVLKGSGGNSAITVAAAGTTTFAENATLSGTGNSIASLGSVTTGTLSSGVTFPAGHILAQKSAILAITGTVFVSTASTTWVGTNSGLNITHGMENQNNYLLFTICSGQPYINTGSNYYYIGIGKTTDLTGDDANIIRYGSDNTAGRIFSLHANATIVTGFTAVFRYYPATTDSITYQPLQKVNSATQSYMTNNSDGCNLIFSLTEVKV